MINKSSNPKQISCSGVMLTFYPMTGTYRIGYREKTGDDGLIQPGRQITVNPYRIASGENPLGFADMLLEMADSIQKLSERQISE